MNTTDTEEMTSDRVVDAFERHARLRAERSSYWAEGYNAISAHAPEGADDHNVRVWSSEGRIDLIDLVADDVKEELSIELSEYFDGSGRVTYYWWLAPPKN